MRIDLHRHLEGSHSPRALLEVARTFRLRDPLFFDATNQQFRGEEELRRVLTMSGPSDDALVFYECIKKARAAYVSEAVIGELARLAFLEAAEETDAFEMRISLFSMTRTLLENEGQDWRAAPPVAFARRAEGVLRAVLAARDSAEQQTGKQMLIRLGLSRTFESEPHYQALADMVEDHTAALCGLDVLGIVTGADKEPLPEGLREILLQLRRKLPDLSLHAGEFESHASVDRTLELRPQAIGHGVHAVQSEATMGRLAEEGVTLEVCPSSNALLIPSALSTLTSLRGKAPLRALQHAGVHCVLGSDDPTPMGTSFADEWRKAEAAGVDMAKLEADIDRRWSQLQSPA